MASFVLFVLLCAFGFNFAVGNKYTYDLLKALLNREMAAMEYRLYERLRVNEAKVGFHAWISNTLSNIPQGARIRFDHPIVNLGDAYNHRTGLFIAPRDGNYAFAWTILVIRGHAMNAHLIVNGQRLGVAQAEAVDSPRNQSGSNLVITFLKKGSTAFIQAGRWAAKRKIAGDGHTTFSGWSL